MEWVDSSPRVIFSFPPSSHRLQSFGQSADLESFGGWNMSPMCQLKCQLLCPTLWCHFRFLGIQSVVAWYIHFSIWSTCCVFFFLFGHSFSNVFFLYCRHIGPFKVAGAGSPSLLPTSYAPTVYSLGILIEWSLWALINLILLAILREGLNW